MKDLPIERLENETIEEWLKRMDDKVKFHCDNLNKIREDMKRDGVKGFCNECGCNIYIGKEHKCD